MARKIIQIATTVITMHYRSDGSALTRETLYALCDDGSAWYGTQDLTGINDSNDVGDWQRLAPIPQED